MARLNMTKAVGYGVILWLVITGLTGAVYGFGLCFQQTESLWVRLAIALIAGGVALFFAKEIEIATSKKAAVYSLSWLAIPILLDLFIISWMTFGIFSTWEYWLGHILIFLSPWIILYFNQKGNKENV